jgi:N-acetylated-alpha-linked acidic dipeptidase
MLKSVRASLLSPVVFASIGVICAQNPVSAPILGFTAAGTAAELKLENQYKASISTERIRDYHRYFTSVPHPAGTKADYEVAHYIAEEWRKQGLEDVVIRQYDVLGTRPVSTSLEMVAPKRFSADLREQPYEVDPDTGNPEVSSAWIGFSSNGEVTAPVVYAHSGNPEDYELLKQHGIDVKGKIVLVRYSNPYSYRGFKALTAQRMGAAALLIYSDPAEDGYKKGKVFPDGPWGPESHIQRGAITYDFMVPGDPLTPGWASLPGAKRIPESEAVSLPHLMALPLSWHDAKPLLENMDGAVAPEDWQGGLPITYRMTGSVVAHLKIEMDNSTQPYYVVEARIKGSQYPDEWVLMGNHHDAWVYGGVDPSSGTASMMEMTRAFGALLKQGTRPKRTLVFGSWDGEEVGLTGSTEWGEQFSDVLRTKLVAYLNVDSSAAGPNFEGGASGSLAPFLVETSRSIADPGGGTLHDAWLKSAATERKEEHNPQPVSDANVVNTRIGSGSDHTVFLNFLGRPVITLEFDGPYGVYHSVYDDFYWMNHFGDPGYKYHATMSQLWGVTALRLAQADVLPLDFHFYGATIGQFLDELAKNKKYEATKLSLTAAHNAARELETASARAAGAIGPALASGKLSSAQTASINQLLMKGEANFILPEGIPGRPWFKHILYSSRYTYAHLELPAITEAVEAGNWTEAQRQTEVLVKALNAETTLMKQAEQVVKPN